MEFDYFLYNKKILPISKAVVSLFDIEYAYGFGVYESVRVSKGAVNFIDDHIERLIESAKVIGLKHNFSQPVIEKGILGLVAKTQSPSFNIKILLIGASEKEDASLFALCLNPFFLDKKLYKNGADFITYNHERVFPHAKSLNMLPSYVAYKKAKRAGAYDALLINRNGFITEGTRTNFFCIKDKIIYTPPDKEVLLGVTRKALFKVAQLNDYEIIQKNIRFSDVKNYENAFVSSTSAKILPIKKINTTIFQSPSEDLKKLMNLFDDFLTKCNGKI